MKIRIVLALAMLPAAAAQMSEVTVRHARDWKPNASEGWCAIKVWVDDEAEFALQGETLRMATTSGQPARDVASECSTPLPRNIENFTFRGVDGRGEVRLLEEPTARNGWKAVVRIRDRKAGGEEHHFRLEWGRGSVFSSGGGGRGSGGGRSFSGDDSRAGSSSGSRDAARMPTRDLRREIERLWENRSGRRPSMDTVDDYIDRVRFDRWTMEELARDIERRAR